MPPSFKMKVAILAALLVFVTISDAFSNGFAHRAGFAVRLPIARTNFRRTKDAVNEYPKIDYGM